MIVVAAFRKHGLWGAYRVRKGKDGALFEPEELIKHAVEPARELIRAQRLNHITHAAGVVDVHDGNPLVLFGRDIQDCPDPLRR